jgi:methyltransferase-like protein
MSEKMLIKRADLNIRTVDQEIVIVDKDSGEVHQLNQTASYIWKLFDGNTSIDQAKELVANDFNIGLEQASADVVAVVEQLKSLNLLVVSGSS